MNPTRERLAAVDVVRSEVAMETVATVVKMLEEGEGTVSQKLAQATKLKDLIVKNYSLASHPEEYDPAITEFKKGLIAWGEAVSKETSKKDIVTSRSIRMDITQLIGELDKGTEKALRSKLKPQEQLQQAA